MKNKFIILNFIIFFLLTSIYGGNFIKNTPQDLRIIKINEIEDSGIEIIFNRDIVRSDYKVYDLDQKNNYRSIVDIKSILMTSNYTFKPKNLKEIRVAQFNNKTTRVVFSSQTDIGLSLKNSGSVLQITPFGINLANKTDKKPQKIRTIVIDPGHGGKDPGAQGNGKKEKDIVLSVAQKTGKILENLGYKVKFTRNSDKFIELKARTSYANKANADLFISIHANASAKNGNINKFVGFETFFLSPSRSEKAKNAAALENKGSIEEMNYFTQQTFLNFLNREKIIQSNKLAIDIHKNTLSSIKNSKFDVVDGGVREAPFWVLVGALMPAVLIEVGYITHPVEGKNIAKTKYQDAIANGIAKGVVSYFLNNQ